MMQDENEKRKIAIIGGGPAGLFLLKQWVEAAAPGWEIHIYERKAQLGAGMPYSTEGSSAEHVTNVSDKELPPLVTDMSHWIEEAPPHLQEQYGIYPANFNEYKVVPRLLFGQYLSDQFTQLLQQAAKKGLLTAVHLSTAVTDLQDHPERGTVTVVTEKDSREYDRVVICTGHHWPRRHEGVVPHYFDSPYPPDKLKNLPPVPMAIRGSSLTALDALRTLSRLHGEYLKKDDGTLAYRRFPSAENFSLVMHSLDGLLPAIRIHFDDFQLSKDTVLTAEDLAANKKANEGFLSLDFLFEKEFKETFRSKDPQFYEEIKDLTLEAFVEKMMDLRERLDPFVLFRAEYAEAQKSIRRKDPIAWKEMLAVLSFAMNHPAKHLSAEDMLRLKKVLMPLISIVIAFVPQSSAEELLALQEAGVLQLVAVDRDSEVVPQPDGGVLYRYRNEEGKTVEKAYPVFVDCIGQPQLPFEAFPFATLRREGSVSAARLRFRRAGEAQKIQAEGGNVEKDAAGNYYLPVPGLAINDHFQVLDQYGAYNPRLYIMAVPFIGGLSPDYSGLDFCEAASSRIVNAILQPEVVA